MVRSLLSNIDYLDMCQFYGRWLFDFRLRILRVKNVFCFEMIKFLILNHKFILLFYNDLRY